jgi:hypothetical protein
MDFVLPGGKSVRLLAPFADMLNHSSEVKQCHVYNASSGDISVFAGRDYKVGDQVRSLCFSDGDRFGSLVFQVFINYGPVHNNRLLRLYGFVIPDNPNDSYDLVLSTHSAAPLFEQKQKLWVSAGLDSTATIPLTLTDPLPSNVLRYLRIQRLDESDLAVMVDAGGKKISNSNELQVLQSLIESFSALLASFGTQLEKLQEQLAEGVYSPGGNRWAMAHVSLGEQRVLGLARQKAMDLLVDLQAAVKSGNFNGSLSSPAECANCGKASAQLMLCGRCKAIKYCGRACQVAHYKEHKAICRPPVS